MQWTSDAPTEAGFYWLKKGEALHMVKLYHELGDDRLWAQYHGTEYEETVDHLGGCEWQGPIVPEG